MSARLLTTVDLLANAVFALEGALIGIDFRLDVFGVLVMPVAMAVGAAACFALRVAAVAGRWNLPVPGR